MLWNVQVCEEWFARIREASMNASAAIQFHAGTYHHASHRLQDLRGLAGTALREFRPQQLSDSSPSLKTKVQQDVSRLMRHASLALCRLHEDDTLSGLQVWVLSTFGSLLNDEGLPLQIGSNPGPFAWMTGLTCQARGQYERAAAHYTHLLQEEQTMAAMGAEGIQFTIARTIESFVAIGDWESLDMWLQELQLLRSKHAGKAYSGALTTAGNDMNAIHALARFDAGDPAGAWGYLDLTPQSSSELTADPRQALLRSEQMLLQAMLRPDTKKEEIASEIAVAKAMIEDGCQVAVLDGLTEAAASIVQMECIQVFEAFRFAGLSGEKWLVSALPQTLGSPLDPWHQDSLLWLKLLRVYRAVSPGTPVTLQLHQQLVRLARKQCNLRLARRLLHEISNSKTPSLEDQMEISDYHSSLSASLRYEHILLLHAEEKHEDALVDLWHFCESQIRGSIELSLSGRDGDLTIAKACLKLSTWLQCKPLHVPIQSMLAKVGLHQNVSDDMEAADTNDAAARVSLGRVANTEFSTLLQEIIGAGTKSATLICPSMAKAWFSYASWCYDFASGLFSGSNKASPTSPVFGELLKEELSANRSSLTNEEVASVQRILENAVLRSSSTSLEALDPNSRQQMEAFVQIVIHTMEAAAGAAGSEDSDGDPPSFQFAQLLQEGLQMLPSIPPINSFLSDLMPIWWALRYRRVSMFGHAARGFLQYLAMSNHGCSKGCSLEHVKPERGDFRLRASLYVLCILLNYGVELEESLQQGLAAVPPSPWQVC
jgi:PI-3-kinase-related kinase SMG-1